MKKNFFAFLNELDHSKQFLKKSRENDLLLTPPPLLGKIPDNSGLFLRDAFPKTSQHMSSALSCETTIYLLDFIV